jgi:drug/metabolite transporter (DMT)-like permease
MKKIIAIASVLFATFTGFAQQDPNWRNNFYYSPEYFNVIASILVVALFMVFIITILNRVMEHRIKNKIIDKGIPENIISSILESKKEESSHLNIKWFALLAGIGAGLTIVNYTLPLGFHSLATMAFSISLSFLGYYFFIKKSEK